MTSGCGKPLPQKIVIYCTTVLAAFSTGVIGFKEATSLLAAFSQSDYVQVVEVLLVYGMLSWMAYCVLVSIGVEMASELVNPIAPLLAQTINLFISKRATQGY